MNIIVVLYLFLSFFTLLWPVILFLCKKHVLPCQWNYIFTQLILSATFFLYTTFFIPSLEREYVLCYMFTTISMFCAPMYYLFVVSMTSMEGITKKHRRVFVVPILFSCVILVLGLMLHASGYKMFFTNVFHEGNRSFIDGNLPYNLMVVCGYCLFAILLLCSALVIVVVSFVKVVRHHRTLKEYYASYVRLQRRNNTVIAIVTGIVVLSAVFVVWKSVNASPSIALVTVFVLMVSAMEFMLGYYSYHISYSANELAEMVRVADENKQIEMDFSTISLKQRIDEIVDGETYYLNPEANVISLAERLHVETSAIIDTLHREYDCSFADYVNGFRINHATELILAHTNSQSKEMNTHRRVGEKVFVEKVYKASGFNNIVDFKKAFVEVMRVSFTTWMKQW